MKKWLKIALGLVVVIVLIIAVVFYFTSGIKETADGFFKAVKKMELAKARSYLSEDFKASTDEGALKDFLSRSALLNYKESQWSHRQTNGGRGELEGSITTETGGVVPLKMMFVKEKGEWKIYAITKPTAGLQSETSTPAVPAKNAQIVLVKQSMHDFIVSIGKKNMEHFRSTVSQMWQKQHTTEQLNQAFKAVIDSDANWEALNNFEPVLVGEATIDKDGVLALTGYYPTRPVHLNFKQKYIYEGLSWKLLGFNIEAK